MDITPSACGRDSVLILTSDPIKAVDGTVVLMAAATVRIRRAGCVLASC
jgi:hypothetical protein